MSSGPRQRVHLTAAGQRPPPKPPLARSVLKPRPVSAVAPSPWHGTPVRAVRAATTRGAPTRPRAVRTRTGSFLPRCACHPFRGGSKATRAARRCRSRSSANASEIRSPARHNPAVNARTRSPWRIMGRPGASPARSVPLVAGRADTAYLCCAAPGPREYRAIVAGDRRRPAGFTRTVEPEDMTGSPC